MLTETAVLRAALKPADPQAEQLDAELSSSTERDAFRAALEPAAVRAEQIDDFQTVAKISVPASVPSPLVRSWGALSVRVLASQREEEEDGKECRKADDEKSDGRTEQTQTETETDLSGSEMWGASEGSLSDAPEEAPERLQRGCVGTRGVANVPEDALQWNTSDLAALHINCVGEALTESRIFGGCDHRLIQAIAADAERRELESGETLNLAEQSSMVVLEHGTARLTFGLGPSVLVGCGAVLNAARTFGLPAALKDAEVPACPPYTIVRFQNCGAPRLSFLFFLWRNFVRRWQREHALADEHSSTQAQCMYNLCPAALERQGVLPTG